MGRVKAWIMDREERTLNRGSADRYYGRYPEPHIWLDTSMGHGSRLIVFEEEIMR